MGPSKDQRKTAQDLLSLPAGEKAELVEGEIVMMVASQAHSKLQAGVAGLAIAWEQRKRKVTGGIGGLWILTEAATHYDDHNVFVHDIAAFEKAKLPKLSSGLIRALPFWVCEVMSPSNWANDTQKKRLVLEKCGVPYYWLVDPERRSIQVFRLRTPGEHYQITDYVSADEGKVKLEPFSDVEIDLAELFSY